MVANKGDGCLLVAPSFPGLSKGPESEIYLRSRQQKVSCWTAELMARVAENIEKRHITAMHVINIVLNAFDPQSVTEAVNKLLSEPSWDHQTLKAALLDALSQLEERMSDRARSVEMVATKLSDDDAFSGITVEDVRKALVSLASVSQGGLVIESETIILFASVNEIRRRALPHIGEPPQPRRISTVRGDLPSNQTDEQGH
jgi:hypothetical protein